MKRAVFLDRDGTLIADGHYLSGPDKVMVLPGVASALARLRLLEVKLFLFTNQSGVGRGYFSMVEVEAVNRRMLEIIGLGADLFTDVCIATERPDDPPRYRKPSPRFIQEMIVRHALRADRCWMVGDSPSDWQAAGNAGINPVAILDTDGDASMRLGPDQSSVPRYASLLDWVNDALPRVRVALHSPRGHSPCGC